MQAVPCVSVVMVSWNAKHYLSECLESLSREACKYSMEVIVVDNGSTDGSPQFVTKNFPNVRLIQQTSNLGFAKANNIGIQQSAGTYICMVNSDVKVLDGCITKLVDFMQAQPDVGISGPAMLGPSGKLGRSCRGFPTVWNMFCHAIGLDSIFPRVGLFGGYALRYWSQDTIRRVDILGGWFWIIRRKALEEVGLLDEAFFFYAEDMDWCKRFRLKDWGVAFFPGAASIHYGGGSTRNSPVRYYLQEQRADLQYWSKHHSKTEQAIYFCICVLHQIVRLVGHGLLVPISPTRQDHVFKVRRSWHCLLWFLKGAI